MAKPKKDSKGGSEDSKKKPDKKDKTKRESLASEQPPEEVIPVDTGERFITLSIGSLMDLRRHMYNGETVQFGIEFGDTFRALSEVILVGDKETTVDWTVSIPCYPNTFEGRDLIAMHPVHITLMEVFEPADPASDGQGDSQSSLAVSRVFGRCNLDLAAFLVGQSRVEVELLVRQNEYAIGEHLIPWQLSPRLTVTATLVVSSADGILDDAGKPASAGDNFFSVTIESMHNLAPSLTSDLLYRARTCNPSLGAQHTLFDGGVWAQLPNRDRTKRWAGLSGVVGAGAYTGANVGGVELKKPAGFVVNEAKLQARHVSHVEWNLTRRFYVPDKEALFVYVHKYGCWPLEIEAVSPPPPPPPPPAPPSDEEAGDEPVDEPVAEPVAEPVRMHLAVYLDVSDLARPGETRTRVAAQVFTFSPSEQEERSSLRRSMFDLEPVVAPPEPGRLVEDTSTEAAAAKKGKSAKGKPTKTKTDTPGDASEPATAAVPTAASAEVAAAPEAPPPSREIVAPRPLFAGRGKPTFVIVDLELLRPFTERRIMRRFRDMSEVVPKRPPLAPHVMSIRLANVHFARCIEAATELIAKDHDRFVAGDKADFAFPDRKVPETLSGYLVTTGTYQKVRETLKNKVANLIREKLGRGERVTRDVIRPFLEDMHVHFTGKMRAIVRDFLFNRPGTDDLKFQESERVLYYAQEANEEDGANAARHLYSQRIANDVRNANYWLDAAVFRAHGSVYLAMECLRDVLLLDNRNQIAWLVYGVLMARTGELRTAEATLKYLVGQRPGCARCWLTLTAFYSVSLLCPLAADKCLTTAKRCWKDREELHKMGEQRWVCVDRAPIVWNPNFLQDPDLYLDTGIFLLKLNLTHYSEFGITQSLIHNGRSPAIIYYSAANLYLQGHFDKASAELATFPDPNVDVVALQGHCAYRGGAYATAAAFFESAIALGARQHFVHLRLGKCYQKLDRVETAKDMLTASWRLKISPESCLGVGVCLYRLKEYLEANRALTIGNSLSHSNAQIWAYLALVHEKLKRYVEFQSCYEQAVRFELKDDQLLATLEDLMQTLLQRGVSTLTVVESKTKINDQVKEREVLCCVHE